MGFMVIFFKSQLLPFIILTLSPSRSTMLAVVTSLSDSCISFLLFLGPLLPIFSPWMLTKCIVYVKIMINTRKRKIIKSYWAGEISQQLLLYRSYQLSELLLDQRTWVQFLPPTHDSSQLSVITVPEDPTFSPRHTCRQTINVYKIKKLKMSFFESKTRTKINPPKKNLFRVLRQL